MRIKQKLWKDDIAWSDFGPKLDDFKPQLILVFGTRKCLEEEARFEEIKSFYPAAHIFGCSTRGEICGAMVLDDSISLTAIEFEHTTVQGRQIHLSQVQDSFQAGKYLATSLPQKGLSHVLLLSDGLHINGSELLRGLMLALPAGVTITGGMAASGDLSEETLVFFDSPPKPNTVALLGFYGQRLKVGYGSMSGYDPFGPQHFITRSAGNILYELEGRPALALYKKYLGEYAEGLPDTGIRFPLCISGQNVVGSLVRTILAVNEEEQSLTFGGNIPAGAYARMMKANLDHLIDAAITAAERSLSVAKSATPKLAVLISCSGRRAVLNQRTEEELEAVSEVLGSDCRLCGFYSYGEYAPFKPGDKSDFHNQTMTISVFWEV